MKIHKFTVYVHDFEGVGLEGSRSLIDNLKYVSAKAIPEGSIEVTDWTDDHPTNQRGRDLNKWWKENET